MPVRHPDEQRTEQGGVAVAVERDDGGDHDEEARTDGGAVDELDGTVLTPDHQGAEEEAAHRDPVVDRRARENQPPRR